MSTKALATQAKQAISAIDIESAKICLDSKCAALSAISNAIEALLEITPPPKGLFSHTIPRLASHVVYLADSLQEEVGLFLDQLEEAQ